VGAQVTSFTIHRRSIVLQKLDKMRSRGGRKKDRERERIASNFTIKPLVAPSFALNLELIAMSLPACSSLA